MKKIFAILLAVMLIASMTVTTYAVTPPLGVPDMPEIPDISDNIRFELPDSFWNKWFNEHFNWKPTVKIELPDDFWGDVKFDFFGN